MQQTFDKFLTEGSEKKLFVTLRGAAGWQARRDLHAIQLMRSSGCRVGTLVRLTVGDATAALTSGRLVFRPEVCKRKRGYDGALTNKIRTALQGLLAIRRELKLGLDPDAPLVVSRVTARGGQGMTTRAVQMRLAHWRAKAGLVEPVTPHWLRHTLGQRIMRNSTARDPRAVAAEALGHSSLSSTLIYTRPSRADVALAMQEAGA